MFEPNAILTSSLFPVLHLVIFPTPTSLIQPVEILWRFLHTHNTRCICLTCSDHPSFIFLPSELILTDRTQTASSKLSWLSLLWGRLTLPLPKLSWDVVLWIHVSPWDICCLHLPYHSQAQQLEYLLLCKYRHRAVDPWILIKLNCLIWFSWNLSQVSISFPLKKNFSWLYWVFIAVHVFL